MIRKGLWYCNKSITAWDSTPSCAAGRCELGKCYLYTFTKVGLLSTLLHRYSVWRTGLAINWDLLRSHSVTSCKHFKQVAMDACDCKWSQCIFAILRLFSGIPRTLNGAAGLGLNWWPLDRQSNTLNTEPRRTPEQWRKSHKWYQN